MNNLFQHMSSSSLSSSSLSSSSSTVRGGNGPVTLEELTDYQVKDAESGTVTYYTFVCDKKKCAVFLKMGNNTPVSSTEVYISIDEAKRAIESISPSPNIQKMKSRLHLQLVDAITSGKKISQKKFDDNAFGYMASHEIFTENGTDGKAYNIVFFIK